MKRINLSVGEGKIICAEVADSFFTRFLGLMGRRQLPSGQGLLLTNCNSVHMCFMRFAIDVVYLDRDFRILKTVRRLRPWLGVSMCLKAWATLEIPAGDADRLNLVIGQNISPLNIT